MELDDIQQKKSDQFIHRTKDLLARWSYQLNRAVNKWRSENTPTDEIMTTMIGAVARFGADMAVNLGVSREQWLEVMGKAYDRIAQGVERGSNKRDDEVGEHPAGDGA